MILTTANQNEKVSNEAIWRKNGYFSDEKSDFNISNKDFPEDCLICTNQGYISTLKLVNSHLYSKLYSGAIGYCCKFSQKHKWLCL